ncbi:MAG: tetraacyldisaccharide 4'-kinase, partial [Marinicaulis sp.]|nr:tetraacyldisaccharide 4'-kinase [Marinicaulis sp.]
MIREPWFWRSQSATARAIQTALSPLSAVYDLGQRARAAMTTPKRAPVPVICVGNATLGGVGKTPFAIALAILLKERSVKAHFLTRGYGGRLKGPIKVNPATHNFEDVGDEALLLARTAPTWVSANRPAGAELAAKDADMIIMDDGFQNPTIHKDCSILLMSKTAIGNKKIFPAGPMREPMSRAVARSTLRVIIANNDDETAASGDVHTAITRPVNAPTPQSVIAFCGIGAPEKFFRTLRGQSFEVAQTAAFADHHPYTSADITALRKLAQKNKAALITTEKDAVRLPPEFRDDILVLPITMEIKEPDRLADEVLK